MPSRIIMPFPRHAGRLLLPVLETTVPLLLTMFRSSTSSSSSCSFCLSSSLLSPSSSSSSSAASKSCRIDYAAAAAAAVYVRCCIRGSGGRGRGGGGGGGGVTEQPLFHCSRSSNSDAPPSLGQQRASSTRRTTTTTTINGKPVTLAAPVFYLHNNNNNINHGGNNHINLTAKRCFRTASTSKSTNLTSNKSQPQHDSEMTKADNNEKKPFERLPKNIKPYNYEIHLSPDLEKVDFTGDLKVHIDVIEPTDTVLLNSVDLDLRNVLFKDAAGNKLHAQSVELQEEEETATITFPEKLPAGKSGHIEMVFSGKMNKDNLKGIYYTQYTSADGTLKNGVVTQFEAIDARRCFPCWDEPAIKATFDISLTVPKDLTALSNMPVKSTIPVDNTKHTLFYERSPLMPTYLVAIVIGEYDYAEDVSEDGVLVRVYAPRGEKEKGQFALEVATKVLPFYKAYFNIPYPLPKIDLVAVSNFSAGAMENWGLVTYRETCLLFDPENTSTMQKQWISTVISHELAHQWFGNLVTMEWWTHLWLNEGYATFTQYLCVNNLFPEYDIWTQFITDYFRALELDSLKNTHAIEVPVNHPDEISEIFDDISYYKGSCAIRMLHSYIGDDDFRKGMHNYLKKHSYANAQTEDLWAALGEASQKPIGKIMSTWTKQKGFPLVQIEEIPSNDPKKRVFKLKQNRFIADGSPDTENTLWQIPLMISCSLDPKKIIYNEIFDTPEKEIEIEGVPKDSWIKVNPGTIGFFRTKYSKEMFNLLGQGILNKSLSPLDRLGIIDDLCALSQAGVVQIDQVLRLMLSFRDETNYTVWCSLGNCLSKFKNLIMHLDLYKDYQMFARSLLYQVYDRLGWDSKSGEGHLDALLRSLVINWLVCMEDPKVLTEAKVRYDAHISKKATIPADLRGAVYRAVLLLDSPGAFDNIMKIYRECDLNDEKERILGTLGCTKNPDRFMEILKFSISDEVKEQNSIFAIISVTSSYQGRVVAWEFIKEHIDMFVRRYSTCFLLPRLIKHATYNFVTESYAKDVEEFFKAHPVPLLDRTIQQSLESIRLNESCLKRNIDNITEFLKDYRATNDSGDSGL